MGIDNTYHPTQTPNHLLELAALDDLVNFKLAIESHGLSIDQVGLWYTRFIGSNKMGFQERTPLMVASLYGSVKIVDYILAFNSKIVNQVCGSDQVTALHCAVAGGSPSSADVIRLLVSAFADLNILDANGNRASDLIPMLPKIPLKSNNGNSKQLDSLLRNGLSDLDSGSSVGSVSDFDMDSKKEFAMAELPDINNGVYGSDEFRMYCFKIKPCSRAYTHDWTECPFAHPGENARRRDPNKYQYTCVPCPEFKKGSCKKGEECEFAHGVFESWLHPAQYRTRLCKDEIGCSRKVCFFAHKKEELRPVYASTGSALPDVGSSPGGGGGGFSGCTTPPMSPSFAPLSPGSGASGGGGGVYQGKSSFGVTPPNLQLPGSRLRSSLSARDMELERELIKMETQLLNQYQQQQQHQHQQVLSPRPSPRWNNNNIGRVSDMIPSTNLEQAFASINVARKMSPPNVMDSPLSGSRKLSPPRALDSPKSLATTMLNSRAVAFAKRSQSFIDRSGSQVGSPFSSPMSSPMADWGPPNGKVDWKIHGEELNKLRKSNSFAFRGNANNGTGRATSPPGFSEPDVSWVNSLVKDEAVGAGFLGAKAPNYGNKGARNGGQGQDMCSPWEQLYIEEQLVA